MKVPLKHIPKINEIINSNIDRVDKECEILALLMNKPLRISFGNLIITGHKFNFFLKRIKFID
jgi:hypothetical protein